MDTSCGLNVQFLDFYFSPWPCFPFPGTKLLRAELWLRILAAVSALSWTQLTYLKVYSHKMKEWFMVFSL